MSHLKKRSNRTTLITPVFSVLRATFSQPCVTRIPVGCTCVALLSLVAASVLAEAAEPKNKPVLRAGAASVDVTSQNSPVIVNGYFNERIVDRVTDRVMSRALVLDDGQTRLAIVVVDNLMIPRDLLDLAKEMAHEATGIPTERMLISSTHTHSAPAAMACLGSRADDEYRKFLPGQIAKSIHQAAKQLTPAKVGWTAIQDPLHNHCRRWIFRGDRIGTDPFGTRNVRANMHPGYQSPNHIGPSGPADHGLSLLSVQSLDGKPLAVLGNYAMHYYGSTPVSGDFCGRFGDQFAKLIGVAEAEVPFVGIMSQGTSGDTMWMDYGGPATPLDLDQYTLEVAQVAHDAYQSIEYQDWVSLAMAESTLRLDRRAADEDRLAWANATMEALGTKLPHSRPEIYAREVLLIDAEPQVELKLQAIRIGDLGITALPNEVYGITGLKLKAQSPLSTTFNIELANGAEGYIPPPEQHALGGYTTWPARTASLEVEAEPKIVATLLELLEKVAEKPRREALTPANAYSEAVVASAPVAQWRLGELAGNIASDATGKYHGQYEPGVAFYLPGFIEPEHHAAHFAGGRVKSTLKDLGDTYTVELWFWNGLPHDARAVTGYLFSRGLSDDATAAGDHLGIGGTYRDSENAGRLFFYNGNKSNQMVAGSTDLELKTWNHVALIRDGSKVTVHLNGNPTPEISGEFAISRPAEATEIFLGGRNDGFAPLEGKLTEVALYDRVISADEVSAHYQSARSQSSKVSDAGTSAKPAEVAATHDDLKPMSPADSLAATHVREGYEIQLVAAEPLVKDPVAIEWGADGRLWVAEMADYPLGMDGNGKPGGRIRFLEDTNGDGQYDRSTLFMEGIRFPNGVMPWRNGVIVTAAPEIFYAEDTDNDGRADKREVLFSGFQEGNQQLRVNGLRWGLDNWIHCASGAHHGGYGADRRIDAVKANNKIVLGSRDFRFRADTGELDPQSGPSQFGRDRDDWGNWFGEQNSFPIWHYVLQDHYLRRNTHFAPPDARKQLVLPGNPKVYPAKSPQKRFHNFQQSGRFTSACSAMVYRDQLLFPTSYDTQHAFTCEPFHNLVQHNVLQQDGVSFVSHRDEAESEIDFFASKDRWCRPVMTRTGPDGALWVVDMYRYMIEHPQWLTPEGREELKPHYRLGEEYGRIYRIVPKSEAARKTPKLQQQSTAELVATLASPNGPQRDLASQVLLLRGDQAALAPLQTMVASNANPLARLHALCTLDGMEGLSASLLQTALADAHPGVRRHAIRLAEPMASEHPELMAALVKLAGDTDAKVRLQLACTLGQYSDRQSAEALSQLALRDGNDPYLMAAVTSSIHADNLNPLIVAALAAGEDPAAGKWVSQLLTLSVALDNPRATLSGLQAILDGDQVEDLLSSDPAWRFRTVSELQDALKRHQKSLEELCKPFGEQGQQVREQVAKLTELARDIVEDADQDEVIRIAAIGLLARDSQDQAADQERLGELLSAQTPPNVQVASVRHLGTLADPQVGEQLIAQWQSYSPSLRTEILSVLTTRVEWLTQLLDAMEQGEVSRTDIDAGMRQSLVNYRNKAIAARAAKLLNASGSSDRRKVVLDHQPVLKLTGSVEAGRAVFAKRCAACHKMDGVGHELGPNLRSITDRNPSSLLTAILDPSDAADAKYLSYIALTDDGRAISGLITSETAGSITMVGQENKQQVILRSELEEIRSTGKSLMPDGLEQDMSHQDIADLIAYLRSEAPKP
ncbi:Cytochrome c [Novipirellula galeiformis]|uniref:Cytochrome c n=1 Tax=Novipirellula galeiformis TaxID=2528004 RepID=A0A5C6C2S1_9BACT|nr:Cytochrome c [Novipirellula galeiformis]